MKTTKRAVAQKKFDALDVSKKSAVSIKAVKLVLNGNKSIGFNNENVSEFDQSRDILHTKEILTDLGIEHVFEGESLTILTKIRR